MHQQSRPIARNVEYHQPRDKLRFKSAVHAGEAVIRFYIQFTSRAKDYCKFTRCSSHSIATDRSNDLC